MSFQIPGAKIHGLTIPGADLDTQILIPAPKPKGAGGIITISGLAQPFMQGRTKIASGHIESTLYAHASGKHRLAYDPDGNHVLKFGTIPCGDTLLSIVGTKMILYHIAMIVAQGVIKIHPYQLRGHVMTGLLLVSCFQILQSLQSPLMHLMVRSPAPDYLGVATGAKAFHQL